jgi:hypothetical protein
MEKLNSEKRTRQQLEEDVAKLQVKLGENFIDTLSSMLR